MNRKFRSSIAGAAAAATAISLMGVAVAGAATDPILKADTTSAAATIGGAGSTFDGPLFAAAQPAYTALNHNATINAYPGGGSGTGIKDIVTGVTNWGASDVPMTQKDITANNSTEPLSDFVQVPVALGGVAISYNVPGLPNGVILNGPVLSAIYKGTITKWNDPAIVKLNPKLKKTLPDHSIVVISRADKSGTTYIFTNYLQVAGPAGAWTASKAPITVSGGLQGTGNGGVASDIANTKYSVGYIEYSYVLLNKKLANSVANIINGSGTSVAPSPATVALEAAANAKTVSSTSFAIVNLPGKGYPISGYSWGIIKKNQTNDATGTLLVKFFDWLSHTPGQTIAAGQGYVALPTAVQTLARTTLLQVKNGSTVLLHK